MPPSHRIVRAKDSVENRRARGEISCAECRRHKLKCDKAIPCSTCVRKGCQSICPNGTLAPTHGTRPISTDAVAFDSKLAELSNRIRQLEDALQISHSTVSTAPHPLLAEDLLHIKNRAVASTSNKADNDTVDTELVESFGTLAVTDRGTELYLGGPSYDLAKHCFATAASIHPESSLTLPKPVSYLSKAFPFTPLYLPAREIQECIEEKLPSYERASSLTEAFLENLSWFFRPVEREQIMGELIPIVYKKKRRQSSLHGPNNSDGGTPSPQSATDPHVLALLLAVFAAGAAADMTLPPWNDEAELYYHLARTALSLKPVFEGAGLHAVQAIALVGAYDLFSCRKNELEGSWKIVTFSLSIAASIGLNRDPAHFDLSPTLIQRRRRVFWELHSIDVWKCLATGRPVTFTNSVIDCEFPDDTDANLGGGPDNPDSIWRIRYRYIKDIMTEIANKLSSTQAVKYSEILALDQRIREYDPQGIFSSAAREHIRDHTGYSLQSLMRLHQLSIMKDITLMLLHRSFFAHALVEDPVNPVRTRFGPSFLSMYRSAASIIGTLQKQISECGHYLTRCWPVLGHALHAAIVLGSIAACGTTSALAPQAFIHFENAVNIFTTVQMHPLIEAVMPIMTRLREQALQALAKHGNEVPSYLRPASSSPEPVSDNRDFHALTSFGRMVRRSLDGEFGTTPVRIRDFVQADPGAIASGGSSPSQLSTAFSGRNGSYPKQGGVSTTLSTMPEYEPLKANTFRARRSFEHRTDSDGDSEMSHPDSVPGIARRSFSLPRDPPISFSLGRAEAGASNFNGQSRMHVDQHTPVPANNGSSNGNTSDPPLYDLRSSPTPDIMNTYTTFSNFPNDDNMTGTSFLTDAALVQSPSDASPLSSDPFSLNSLSHISPGPFFDPDFDVSFDMRSSAGQESVLPLLPGDMEAWRTIIQDSRFFGLPGETTESERGTPK